MKRFKPGEKGLLPRKLLICGGLLFFVAWIILPFTLSPDVWVNIIVFFLLLFLWSFLVILSVSGRVKPSLFVSLLITTLLLIRFLKQDTPLNLVLVGLLMVTLWLATP